jgi:hypothetical protein
LLGLAYRTALRLLEGVNGVGPLLVKLGDRGDVLVCVHGVVALVNQRAELVYCSRAV